MVQVALDAQLELSTLARSFAFLEKLILKRLVAKQNRREVGAVCLVLASKATDLKNVDYHRLIEVIGQAMAVTKKRLLELEFAVFAALSFRLQISDQEFGGHLVRLLTLLDYSNLQEYLGERMYQNWQDVSSLL